MTAARGELWLVDLGMTAKVRPALVISVPADDADRALVTIVPHTTSLRASRFEVAVSVPVLRAGMGRDWGKPSVSRCWSRRSRNHASTRASALKGGVFTAPNGGPGAS
jgi:hypothetical protein